VTVGVEVGLTGSMNAVVAVTAASAIAGPPLIKPSTVASATSTFVPLRSAGAEVCLRDPERPAVWVASP